MRLRTSATLTLIVAILFGWGLMCIRVETPTEPTATADSLNVYPDSISLQVGDTVQLTAVAYDGDSILACSGACDTIPELSASQQKIAFRDILKMGEKR